MDIERKTVLVTGATGGIGRKLCAQLDELGATLVMTGRDKQALADLHQQFGNRHYVVEADLSTSSGRAGVLACCSDSGGIDAVINLAGITDFGLFENQSPELIEKILNINLVSLLLFCHELLPQLTAKSESSLINVGSIFGSIGYPGFAVYCASKAGVKGFTESLGRELADSPVNVSYIAPRATSTAINSAKVDAMNKELGNRSDSPDYVAAEIVKLLKSGKRLRYLGWPEKFFVRVNAIFPNVVFKALTRQLDVVRRHANAK